MRKMQKGAAITGGVFAILSALLSLFPITGYIRTQAGAAAYLNLFAGVLLAVLLGVALFRGKVDVFAGVVFGLNALWKLIALITLWKLKDLIGNLMGGTYLYLIGIGNLAVGAALVLMTLLCFRVMGKQKLLTVLLAAGGSLITVIGTVSGMMGNVDMSSPSAITAAILTAIASSLGAVMGALPVVMAALAVCGCKEPEAAEPCVVCQEPEVVE